MAITYGMSVKEFWEDDPDLFWAFRFSYYTRLKDSQEIFNNNAWLQGVYFYEAVSVALNNGFNKQKLNYSEKPYDINKKDVEETAKMKNNQLADKIKGRIAQMEAIKGKNNKSTTDKGNKKGGEKINGNQSNNRNANQVIG